jgi:hypothetical protein
MRAGDRLRFTRSPAVAAALRVCLFTRVPVLVVGLIGFALLGCPPDTPCRPDNALSTLPARWDSGWYLSIASEGYRWHGRTDIQQNVVFFPAFPLAVRAVATLLGGRDVLAGVLVSIAAFFWASVYLYRLAREDEDHDSAVMCVVFLATYPFAVFFSAIYTESLYLLCATATFYHFRRNQWVRAAGWGLVLGLTRPNGFLVTAPLLLICTGPALATTHSNVGRWLSPRDSEPVGRTRISRRMLIAAAMPIAGLLCYSAFMYWLTGDPIAWIRAQRAWGRGGGPALDGASPGWSLIRVIHDVAPSTPMELLDLAAGIFMMALVVPVTRRYGLPYGLFMVLLLALPLVSGSSQSLGRYTSIMFPAFLWLGEKVPREHRMGLVLCFAMLQGFGAILFFSWRPFL